MLPHIVVQIVKRTVSRPRPSDALACRTLIADPDRFSFPSGHSAAAMAVAFSYAMAFPAPAVPLLAMAFLAGASDRRCVVVRVSTERAITERSHRHTSCFI